MNVFKSKKKHCLNNSDLRLLTSIQRKMQYIAKWKPTNDKYSGDMLSLIFTLKYVWQYILSHLFAQASCFQNKSQSVQCANFNAFYRNGWAFQFLVENTPEWGEPFLNFIIIQVLALICSIHNEDSLFYELNYVPIAVILFVYIYQLLSEICHLNSWYSTTLSLFLNLSPSSCAL